MKAYGGFYLAFHKLSRGCLSVSVSLESPLWLCLEWVPVLTSHRCASTPASLIYHFLFTLSPVNDGCLLVDSLWAIGQQDRMILFTVLSLTHQPGLLFLLLCRPTLSLPQAMTYLTWDMFFSKSNGLIASKWETPKTPMKRIICKNGKVIIYSEWLFNKDSLKTNTFFLMILFSAWTRFMFWLCLQSFYCWPWLMDLVTDGWTFHTAVLVLIIQEWG